MTVTFDLPPNLERRLVAASRNISAEAKQAFAVTLYRWGELTRPQLTEVLGLSRFEIDGVLKAHGVTEDLVTADELARQFEVLDGPGEISAVEGPEAR
jgi:hypothetical protein